jgi:hypothetical protein
MCVRVSKLRSARAYVLGQDVDFSPSAQGVSAMRKDLRRECLAFGRRSTVISATCLPRGVGDAFLENDVAVVRGNIVLDL